MNAPRPRPKVFAVEDESLILMLLEDLLGEIGCDCVATATRLAAARDIAATKTFDLAILDVNLRGETSHPVAEILAGRGVPFIFATGYGDVDPGGQWSDARVLQKPYDARALRAAIEATLGVSLAR